jgi:outer membrane protein assembly factor BamB
MGRACVLLPLCLLTGITGSDAAGQEWTRFRGPNGCGVNLACEIPARWTAKETNWKVSLPGLGHASPVLWGDRVFLSSADPQTATRYVICVSAADGTILWQRPYASQPHTLHVRNSFASSTPAVDEQRLYVAWSTPSETTLLALDHAGQPIWQRDLGPFESQHGFGTSPIVYEDLVILSVLEKKPDEDGPRTETSFIVAVDRATGQTRWQTPRLSEVVSYSTPCLYQPDHERVQLICCSTAQGIFSLDPQTGRENWSTDVFEMRTVSSPVVADDLILGTTGSGGGGNYLVALRPAPRPEVLYRITSQAPYVPTPVVKDGLAFLWYDKGIVSCIRVADGKRVWQQRIGGNYSGSPVIAGSRLFCVDDDGVVVVLSASERFELLGKNPLGEPSRSTPALAGGRMYLRTESHLISIGGGSGSPNHQTSDG